LRSSCARAASVGDEVHALHELGVIACPAATSPSTMEQHAGRLGIPSRCAASTNSGQRRHRREYGGSEVNRAAPVLN
jgi:hypothetical protein